MSASELIRTAVAEVTELRAQAAGDQSLRATITAVKAFQNTRFRGTYTDLLGSERFRGAALFFLHELYSDKDYTQRDAQFVRIAGPLERLFPASVIDTAVSMAKLHAVTERLDMAMARSCQALWGDANRTPVLDAALYVQAWQRVGHRDFRDFQLTTVVRVGRDLTEFTRKRGLRVLLRMMRPAARASGLAALQSFLEAGFDTFGAMSHQGNTANEFLDFIEHREGSLIHTLYTADASASAQALGRTDWDA